MPVSIRNGLEDQEWGRDLRLCAALKVGMREPGGGTAVAAGCREQGCVQRLLRGKQSEALSNW